MFVRRPLTMLFGTSSLYRGAKLNEMRNHPASLRLNFPLLITILNVRYVRAGTYVSYSRRRVQVASTAARWVKKNRLTARGLRGHNFTAWALRGELTSARPPRRPMLPIWADFF
jgi:hypothetical protein